MNTHTQQHTFTVVVARQDYRAHTCHTDLPTLTPAIKENLKYQIVKNPDSKFQFPEIAGQFESSSCLRRRSKNRQETHARIHPA